LQIRKGKNASVVRIDFGGVGAGFKIHKKGVAAEFYHKTTSLVGSDINPCTSVG